MTEAPSTALAAPTRRAPSAADLAPPTTRALELGAVLSLAAPLEAPGDGLAGVRQALDGLSRELVALGGQPLPPPVGLVWAGAPGGELMGAPADASTLAAGRAAASSWAAAVAPAVLAVSPRAAAERIRDALARLVQAAIAAVTTGAVLPVALSRALTAWVVTAQTALNTLGRALMVGVGAGTGTAWLILAALAFFYLARKR